MDDGIEMTELRDRRRDVDGSGGGEEAMDEDEDEGVAFVAKVTDAYWGSFTAAPARAAGPAALEPASEPANCPLCSVLQLPLLRLSPFAAAPGLSLCACA